MSADTSMAEYYARRAAEYERIYDKSERQDDLRVLRDLVEQTFAGANVLEIACGTGYWTQFAAPRAKTYLATDFNEETLTLARAKQILHPALTFATADAFNLCEITGDFDAGLAAFWWSHVSKARLCAFLQSFHARLRPGSHVVFIDNRYIEGSSAPVSRADSAGNSYQTRRLQDGSVHEVLKNFPTESDLRAAVAGLASNIQVRLLPYFWILDYQTA